MNYPIKARNLKANDAKLGGKYRMSNVREFIALAYSLYVSSGKKPSVDYSDGTENSNRLALAPSLSNEISKMLSINNLNDIISNNPLLTGQFEYILVAMERIFCLGTVVFNNRTYNNSKERTGGIRYPKTLIFSTNMMVLDLILSSISQSSRNALLTEWLHNRPYSDSEIEFKITSFLTICSQYSLFRVRTEDDEEIVYRPIGIYEQIEKTGSVSIVDNKEQAGTASIYNNILKENINPWLNSSNTSNISFNANNDITSYLAMLKTSMSIVRVSETDLTGNTSQQINFENEGARNASESFIKYLTALRTKPFMLLAGISGTGKSRIVRKLAQASVTEDLQRLYDPKSIDGGFNRWKLHKPANFELIQVKPNWHNSLEVVGYKSNIGGVHYEFTPFVEFVARAWKHPEVPFFLCLDEMNLAPVEQYFAEFLSAIESRSFENNVYETDPIVKPFVEFGDDLWIPMVNHLLGDINASDATSDSPIAKLVDRFKTKGLTLPQNLLVMGTVNMDETTFSFSRKVLDRAMSVVMNTVEYKDFFNGESENDVAEMSNDFIDWLINRPIRGLETQDNKAEEVEIYLTSINNVLEDTPFKLGYRAANEALLYVSAAHKFNPSIDLNSALDDFTLMKILSRIEGDKRSIGGLLVELQNVITNDYPKSNKKLIKMAETLANKQFVSYWT